MSDLDGLGRRAGEQRAVAAAGAPDTIERDGPGGRSLTLTLSYDGAGFAGSQIQPGRRTVQGELEAVIERLAGRPAPLVFAGRTDAGVHAVGQVVSLPDVRPEMSDGAIARAINAGLPDDVGVVQARRELSGYHARYDARWREYRYRVWSGSPQPIARGLTWQRRSPLDWRVVDEAANRLIGQRDLAALAGGGEGVPWSERATMPRGTVRTILRCSCRPLDPWWGAIEGTLVEVRVAADGFMPRMVRNIVALLAAVGEGRIDAAEFDRVIASKDRRQAGGTAPPQGLILWRVGYRDDEPEP